jgi:hypothetical protein
VLLLALLSGVLPLSLDGQGVVRGVVYDSLRAASVAGAVVTIDGVAGRTLTDGRGRFELRDVPLGPQRIRVRSPRFDSLALGALDAVVEVQSSVTEVSVALPAIARYASAVCGATLEAGQGILLGDVSDAAGSPAGAMHIAALWNETVLTTAGASGLMRGAIDTTTATGFYALCGVPLDAEFQMRAGDDAIGSATLTVLPSAELVRRRDVRIGAPERTVRLRGRMSDRNGRGLEGIVEVLDDSTSTIRTDSTGVFTLSVPERSTQLWVRVVGFTPRTVDLQAAAPETDLGDLVLDRVPQELPGRLIEGRLVSRSEFDFEARRSAGVGVQIDSATLAKYPRVGSTALANETRLVRSEARGGVGEVVKIRQGVGSCFPRVYVDGQYFGSQGGRGIDAAMMGQLLREAKRIEIYTAAYAPAAYPDFDGCGVILIWTR